MTTSDERNERLKLALRENLKRRKARARAQDAKVETGPEDRAGVAGRRPDRDPDTI
ncbi:MAG TPA: hypothetical protein VIL65_08220 [Beijerinckiaceae bacterium]|jgi:hypothetical protein